MRCRRLRSWLWKTTEFCFLQPARASTCSGITSTEVISSVIRFSRWGRWPDAGGTVSNASTDSMGGGNPASAGAGHHLGCFVAYRRGDDFFSLHGHGDRDPRQWLPLCDPPAFVRGNGLHARAGVGQCASGVVGAQWLAATWYRFFGFDIGSYSLRAHGERFYPMDSVWSVQRAGIGSGEAVSYRLFRWIRRPASRSIVRNLAGLLEAAGNLSCRIDSVDVPARFWCHGCSGDRSDRYDFFEWRSSWKIYSARRGYGGGRGHFGADSALSPEACSELSGSLERPVRYRLPAYPVLDCVRAW